MAASKKLSLIHPYIEDRRKEIDKGLYPRQHLWGLEKIECNKSWTSKVVETQKIPFPDLLERILNKLLFRQSPGVKTEIATWRASKSSDLIYSVCGPLSLSRFYKRAKLVSWVFRKNQRSTKQTFDPYSSKNLDAHSGFLCLTPLAQRSFSKHSITKFLPWCIDLEMFDGKPPKNKPAAPFFLATGKTGRDYKTFLDGCIGVNAEIRIIGPSEFKPLNCPSNVKWIDSSQDPPDRAIDYPTLKEWYAQCTAVRIPLTGDTEDTCGYTNMLEAIAMRKPVLMTRSGCLHIDPESCKFGKLIKPQDSKGWTFAMNFLLQNQELVRSYGETGRRLAEKEFTIERFNQDLLLFLQQILTD